ncbi:ABSCISIC ACID-INSENSITIVE 5-like protein 2 [Curcuma longa]|uniref:ABSCISIC ACID-INSENSITIVE 5-like protein 2 n=1 Tax=Curcuma longa TaxID=136217 RepID=UPI003D9EFA12
MGMAMATQGAGGAQQDAQSQSLCRQGSACKLTLDQVEDHLGGPLLSMNLEDLLRNVFPADAGAGAMRKKAVDEVWRHIQRGKEKERQQPRLGEMTLEDFLCRAGVARDETKEGGGSQIVLAPKTHWLHHCHPQQQQQKEEQTTTGSSYVCQPPAPQPQAAVNEGKGANSSTFDQQTPRRRKRGQSEDVVKKKAERRQKRMIKNRESAARSRARKQAYTNELEKKVSSLEEENQRLRQRKELDAMIQYIPQPYPKQQLRRTSSAPV